MAGIAQAVELEGVWKTLGGREVLRGIDLHVEKGTVLGLLGPNGAGKTTIIRVLATLLIPDAGRALISGYDVVRNPQQVRRKIGLTGQYAAVDGLLTGRANLELVARLHHFSRPSARARTTELLKQFDLIDAADRPTDSYSGGMRRRLDLAASLVSRPEVLFVDEPTTGLDPTSRRALWQALRSLVDDGVTVLLTTQYLEEADELADSIVVLKNGEKIAEGTASELKATVRGDLLIVTTFDENNCRRAAYVLRTISMIEPEIDLRRCTVTIEVPEPLQTLSRVAGPLSDHGVEVRTIALRPPSLDEVFEHLTREEESTPVRSDLGTALSS